MEAAAKKHGTRLSFNHQRRFGGIFLEVKKVKAAGRLGKLVRMEATPPNLYDWGTHWVDMMQMFNDEAPAKWVLAALDIRKGSRVFDLLHEDQALAFIEYENGVQGLLMCSLGGNPPALRFIGEKGVLECNAWGEKPLKFRRSESGEAEEIPVTDTQDGHVGRAIAEVINSYRENRPCELSVENAMRATEIIFSAYESVRRRGRVDLPLEINDHPLLALVAAGELKLAK
jgi:UDP-N-acetylglucosamine 3-dehydrogenase